MISTIRSMKKEIEVLNSATIKPVISEPSNGSALLKEHLNRFELLKDSEDTEYGNDSDFITVSNRRKNNRRKNNCNNNKTRYLKEKDNTSSIRPKTNVPFRSVSIVGDSHARGLSTLIAPLVHHTTRVYGICKPGAGLLNIVPTSNLLSDNCLVLMAGSNDVAAGRAYTIFRNLEDILQRCSRSSRVILLPLPPRYDLPRSNPVYRTVSLVNCFMTDLCKRYVGVDMLDIVAIGRHHYTSHGLHLRYSVKRMLAELIVGRLEMEVISASSRPIAAVSTQRAQTRTTLQVHESYAAAVSSSPSTCQLKSSFQAKPSHLETSDTVPSHAFLEHQTLMN